MVKAFVSHPLKQVLIWATCLISGLVAVLPAYALDTLSPGQQLNRGESLDSQNGCFTFILQNDGNLVLYRRGNKALWQAGTSGKAVARAIMQGDGNLVLYGYDNTPVWNSRTDGRDGSRLIVQNDGNVVIYTPSQNRAVWNTKTGTTQVCR